MFQTYLKNIKSKLSKNFGKGNYSLIKKGISTLGTFFINPKYKNYIDTATNVSNRLLDAHYIITSEKSNTDKILNTGTVISPLLDNTRFKQNFDKAVFAGANINSLYEDSARAKLA